MPQINNKYDLSDLAPNPNDLSDLSRPSYSGTPATPEFKKSWKQEAFDTITKDIPIGIGKGLWNIGDLPWRLGAKGLHALGANVDPKSYQPLPSMQPSNDIQKYSGFIPEVASYFLPVSGEAKIGQAIEKGTAALPWATKYLLRMAGKGGVGATTGAVTAAANNRDPVTGAIMGGAVPAGMTAMQSVLRNPLTDWAATSMARAMEPGSKADKFITEKILLPALKAKIWWARPKGLHNIAERFENKAFAERRAIEDQANNISQFAHGHEPQMSYDPIAQHLTQGVENEFLKGRTGVGNLPMANNAPEQANATAFYNWMTKYFEPKMKLDQYGRRVIDASQVNLSKQAVQKYAGSKNAFLDMGRDPVTQAETEAERLAGEILKPELETFYGKSWAEKNKIMSTWIAIKDMARANMGKNLGAPVRLAERGVGGFGSTMGRVEPEREIPGLMTRIMRRAFRSPAWQSAEANAKYAAATSPGFLPAQAANMLTGMNEEGPTEGATAEIPQQAPQPTSEMIGQRRTATNPQTGHRLESLDGGQTWHPLQ